jgi:flap endonuclease-1
MGIRGLTGWIRWAAYDSVCTAPDWFAYENKRIGFDILGFMYKTKAQRSSPLLYMARLVAACKKHGIIPVMIFDGKPPDAKRAALKARSALRTSSAEKYERLATSAADVPMSEAQKAVIDAELLTLALNSSYFTSEERDAVKQLLYACGVLSLNASGEADDVLAHFARRGEIAAVVSNDLDMLARGVQTLLVPDNYALPGDEGGWIQYDLGAILRSVDFTYEQFVEMCALMGSDYTVEYRSIPYKTAYWAIKYGRSFYAALEKYGLPHKPYSDAVARLTGMCTPDELMNAKQWEKWGAGAPLSECENLVAFRKTVLSALDAESYARLSGGV